jgi:DNA-binding NarL/FixJ family response regulator
MKRLMIAAENSLIVDAIAIGLRKSGEFEVLGHVDPMTVSARAIAESQPEVVLVDDMNQSPQVIDLIGQIQAEHDRERQAEHNRERNGNGYGNAGNGIAVIVLTLAMDSKWLDDAFDAGAAGAISKAAHPGALTTLVRETVNGHVMHVSKRHARGRNARAHTLAANGCSLTPRELEVLQLMASGSSNGEIARTLWVTEQTVKFHLSNVYRKLEVANRTEASHYAHVNGLVSARRSVEVA